LGTQHGWFAESSKFPLPSLNRRSFQRVLSKRQILDRLMNHQLHEHQLHVHQLPAPENAASFSNQEPINLPLFAKPEKSQIIPKSG